MSASQTNHKKQGPLSSLRARRVGKQSRNLLLFIILTLITVVFILPYAWMFFSSIRTTDEIFRYTFPLSWRSLIPTAPTLENFRDIFFKWGFGKNILNSLIAATAQMLGTLLLCSTAAFALSRMYFRGRDLIFAIILITSMMPFEAIIVPLYVVVRALGLTNSYAALFLPWIANPFAIFLLRQTFLEIPRDYDEAAKVEGASYFQIFWHIILPNVRPALVTVALISFLLSWNAFMWPLIVMQDPNKQVIQVAIATFTQPGELPLWGNIFAGATAATIPILIVFLVLQRYYVRGIVMSGIKG